MNNEDVIKVIQEHCKEKIFTTSIRGKKKSVNYKDSWKNVIKRRVGDNPSPNVITNHTIREIQDYVCKVTGDKVKKEKTISGSKSGARFDLWNPGERTAIEICLGAIKNEFEKDILKAILDREVIKLIILYREYVTGKSNTVYGEKWFTHPAQQEIMKMVRIFKLEVVPVSLLPLKEAGLPTVFES